MSPELIAKIELGLELLGALVVFATIVVKLTPSKSDNAVVAKIADYIFKVFKYLPTLGVNPKTKELEEALKKHQ
jgi:hypothetical protein